MVNLVSSAAAALVTGGSFWAEHGVSALMTLLAGAVLLISLVLAIRTQSR